VFDMEKGIRDYLNTTGYNDSYYEHTEPMPDFYWIEEEVERCQDVILLLGFWTAEDDYMPPEMWWRIGGHYVTCAGVNSADMQLGISDPFLDNAGAGGPGVVPVPHPYPHNASVHNDTQYVSHDIYDVNVSFTPGGMWALENYGAGNPAIANFQGLNPNPNSMLPVGPYLGAQYPLHVEIEYAVAVSPIAGVNATLQGNVTFVGRGGAPDPTWIEPFVVKGFEPGNLTNELWNVTATTNDTGFFNITGVTPGTYDVGIKNCTCLSRLATNVTLTDGMTTVVDFGVINEGDVKETDKVDGFDFALLSGAYNSRPGDGNWNADADLNRSGKVDGFDFALLSGNYNVRGDAYGGF
jgi:hypothetical protein